MKRTLEDEKNLTKPPRVGDIVEGVVIDMERASVFLDLGAVGTGIIYGKEFIEGKDFLKNIKIGDKIFAKITDLENEEGFFELSVAQAGREITWRTLKEKRESGDLIKVKISKANKGGLMAEISGIPAFLPVSQLSPEHYPRVDGGDTNQILRELQKFIGGELEVKILDLDPKEGKLILSEKAKEVDKLKEVLKSLKAGDVVEGEITAILDFGVFLKFLPSEVLPSGTKDGSPKKDGKKELPDYLEGLIHISELDWQLIKDPSEIVKVGQKVKAKIIDISNGKVSLSLRALKKDPWEGIEEKFKKGDVVSGKVTKFNPFGAFIQIAPKIQGLCHISEFGSQTKMEETLKIGGKYDFRILLIEPKDHRMNLKLAS